MKKLDTFGVYVGKIVNFLKNKVLLSEVLSYLVLEL